MKQKRMAISFFLVWAMMLWMTGCATKQIDLDNYIEVSISGKYAGQAEASVSIDYEELFYEIYGEEEISSLMEYFDIENLVSVSLDKDKQLQNGDVINVLVYVDEEAAKEKNIKFNTSNIQYTVKDLEEMREIDIFNNLEIMYTGISPNISVSVNTDAKEEYLNSWYFSIKPSAGLAIGSTYTIYYGGTEEILNQNGIIPISLEKEITITENDVDAYISSLAQLDASDYVQLDTFISENIASRMIGERENPLYYSPYERYVTLPALNVKGVGKTEYISSTMPKLEATYLLTANSTYYIPNLLYRVYSTEITDGILGTYTAYFVGNVTNVIKYKDGTIYYEPYHIQSNIASVECYDSISAFETKRINSQKSQYNVQKNLE